VRGYGRNVLDRVLSSDTELVSRNHARRLEDLDCENSCPDCWFHVLTLHLSDASFHRDVGAIILERTVRNGILHGPLKKR